MDTPTTEPLGTEYFDKEWPWGLTCAECPHAFREGERFSTLLYAFSEDVPLVKVVCLDCATSARESPEP